MNNWTPTPRDIENVRAALRTLRSYYVDSIETGRTPDGVNLHATYDVLCALGAPGVAVCDTCGQDIDEVVEIEPRDDSLRTPNPAVLTEPQRRLLPCGHTGPWTIHETPAPPVVPHRTMQDVINDYAIPPDDDPDGENTNHA